jgi:hypothetical protein
MANALPDHSQLCDACQRIDFTSFFIEESEEVIGQKGAMDVNLKNDDMPLGTRLEIRKKGLYCAFCALADAAINNTYLGYNEDASVGIKKYYISDNRGPGCTLTERTYGIRLVAKKTGTSGRYFGDIKLLADDAQKLGLSPLFHGREMQPKEFDMSTAIKWLNICRTQHGSLCDVPGRHPEERIPSPQPVQLLAIDLFNMCVCNMPSCAEFVALSYCWPAKSSLVLKRCNYSELMESDSLPRQMHLLPGTVQDAISCAKELLFRYLWVDALCIIQDDDEHKTKQLRQMDRVYGAASLTIVCAYPVASGTSDPCSGLPRYNEHDRPRPQIIREINGLRFMTTTRSAYMAVQETRWDNRCWTFQEHHLSRRILYFTPVQVYFQCSSSVFCEDVMCEDALATAYHAPGSTLWNPKARYSEGEDELSWGEWILSRAPSNKGRETYSYEQALVEYTHRDISFPSDFLNAFEGVMAVLTDSMGTEFWQGLPEKYLDQALLWQLRGAYLRRRVRPTPGAPSSLEPLFPSWSWAGWESPVNLHDYMAISQHRTEVDWFIVRNDGVSVRLKVGQNDHVNITYREDGNKDVTPPLINMNDFLPNILPRSQIDISSKEWQKARTLACYTTHNSFLLDGTQHSLGHEAVWRTSINLAIKDSQDFTVGCILVPPDLADECLKKPQMYDFILISRSLRTKINQKSQYFDENAYVTRDWCTLNVMLVVKARSDQEIFHRVGVGILHEDAWVGAQPRGAMIRLV